MIIPRYFSICLWAGLGISLAGGFSAHAEEPVTDFLTALRVRGYFDTALEYLEQQKGTSNELRSTYDYERGLIFVSNAKTQRDPAVRQKLLDDARAALDKFVKEQAQHRLASAAMTQLGTLLVERARGKVDEAQRPANSANKTTLVAEAQGLFQEARRAFEATNKELSARIGKIPRDVSKETEPEQHALREQLSSDYLHTRILLGAILEELAATHEPDSRASKEGYTAAAKEYDDIYNNYRRLLPGLYAHLYQGRCFLKMGDTKNALAVFTEILDLSDNEDAFRKLKGLALIEAIHCWTKEKLPDEAIKRGADFVGNARGNELREDWFAQLRLSLADAYRARGSLNARNRGDLADARQMAQAVLNTAPNELIERRAKAILSSLPGGGPADKKKAPKTFVEAYEAGREALAKMKEAEENLRELPERIKESTEAEAKNELAKMLEEAKTEGPNQQQQAFVFFQQALTLVAADTPRDDVVAVQYFLAFLHYSRGDLPAAVVAAEFVARRFPEAAQARPCAKIALASWLKMYFDAKNLPDKGAFEADRITRIAGYILERWPDQPEAEEARATLVPFLIRLGRLPEAQQAIDKIPVDSPRRGGAEISTGQAMWASYLVGLQDLRKWEKQGAPVGVDLNQERQRLEATKTAAKTTLMNGIERMSKKTEVEPALVSATNALAQIFVDTSEFDKALALLEEKTKGPLTLVRAKHPAAMQQPGFAEEVRKTTLRAYIGVLPTTKNVEAAVKQAEALMAELKESVQGQEQGDEKLVAIYVSLARKLQEQMKVANEAERAGLSKGFEIFLGRVSEGSKDPQILSWVGETFFALGESACVEGQPVPESAKRYYQLAEANYDRILTLAETKAATITPTLQTQLTFRRVLAQRRQGKFKEALAAYIAMLSERNMVVNLQVDAALLLMEQGDAGEPQPGAKVENGEARGYEAAILGVGRDPKKPDQKIVWGWSRISQLTAREPKFEDTFHQSRYYMATAFYKIALKQDQAAKKKNYLGKAKDVIVKTVPVYPGLGGDKWREKYDVLLKQIQQALGEPADGVSAIPMPAPKPLPPATAATAP